jgi:hypothetical protein
MGGLELYGQTPQQRITELELSGLQQRITELELYGQRLQERITELELSGQTPQERITAEPQVTVNCWIVM